MKNWGSEIFFIERNLSINGCTVEDETVKNEDLLKNFPPEILEAFKRAGIDEIKVIGNNFYVLTRINPNTAAENQVRQQIDEALKNAGYEYKKFRDSYSCSGERIGYGSIKKREI